MEVRCITVKQLWCTVDIFLNVVSSFKGIERDSEYPREIKIGELILMHLDEFQSSCTRRQKETSSKRLYMEAEGKNANLVRGN